MSHLPVFSDPANSLLLRQIAVPEAGETLSFVPREDFDEDPERCLADRPTPRTGCPAGWSMCGDECYNPDTHICIPVFG